MSSQPSHLYVLVGATTTRSSGLRRKMTGTAQRYTELLANIVVTLAVPESPSAGIRLRFSDQIAGEGMNLPMHRCLAAADQDRAYASLVRATGAKAILAPPEAELQ